MLRNFLNNLWGKQNRYANKLQLRLRNLAVFDKSQKIV
jgi:hypothetical protein